MTQPYREADVPDEELERRRARAELLRMAKGLRTMRREVDESRSLLISVPRRSLVNLLDQIILLAEKVAHE